MEDGMVAHMMTAMQTDQIVVAQTSNLTGLAAERPDLDMRYVWVVSRARSMVPERPRMKDQGTVGHKSPQNHPSLTNESISRRHTYAKHTLAFGRKSDVLVEPTSVKVDVWRLLIWE